MAQRSLCGTDVVQQLKSSTFLETGDDLHGHRKSKQINRNTEKLVDEEFNGITKHCDYRSRFSRTCDQLLPD